MPGQQPPLESSRDAVRGNPDQRVDDDRQHDHIGAQELTCIHRKEADAGLGTDGFGHHQRQPCGGERVAYAGQDRGQCARQNDPADQLQRAEALDPAELDQLRIDLPDSQRGVDVDRKGDAERDEEDLFGFTNAEPDDDQRQRGEEWNGADHLDAAVDRGLGDPREADQGAEREADGATDRETRGCPQQADAEVV
ncbi:hypothetical protein chiPu_0031738, partial [Chiloscyllium punctatum]|nr:hypothetical protein [Chiloscyllium punctatum]